MWFCVGFVVLSGKATRAKNLFDFFLNFKANPWGLQLLRWLQPLRGCHLFLPQTHLRHHWPPPCLKDMELHLYLRQPVIHGIVPQEHHLWLVIVGPHTEPRLHIPFPLLQLLMLLQNYHKMDLWTQTTPTHTADFIIN